MAPILIAMILLVVVLFNSVRQPLAIFLIVPTAVIGLTIGLLATGQPFGFMALLGFLSLSGMLIKNAIVLMDEINSNLALGKPPYTAVVEAGVSRMRPVVNTAGTTVLGMIPLLLDPFYASMAVAIMSGLTFGAMLTLIVVPVLYTILFRIPSRASSGADNSLETERIH
jgi:multidrug efflux pump subunit AcrB